MTVTYTAKVATSSFSCFLKLLARWHGSIYKLLWKDFILFAFLYYLLSFIYRFVLDEGQKRIFEMVAKYCDMRNSLIPIAFVLGFYVSIVMTRYFTQLGHIPWPDHMATFVTANVHGLDERGRLMRRTMLRYFNLAYAITMSSISQSVKKNFPTFQHFVKSGLMTQNEMEILNKIKTEHNKFFIPLGWTTALVTRARKEGRIKDDFAVKTLVDEINSFRNHLATLFVYDMISMPLVYTQVVTIAVYTFFLACLMGRQFVEGNAELPDMYFPFFTFLEYLFYMGWLKVAESFVNPFGEDDDDFNILFLIKRNLQVSYLLVDEIHNEHPDLIRDQYWDENNFDVPFTKPTFDTFQAKNPMNGSANDLSAIGVTQKEIQLMETLEELDEVAAVDGVYESPKSPTSSSFIPIIGSLRNIVPSTRSSRRPLLSRSDSKQNPDRPSFVGGPKFQVGSVDTVFQPSSPSASVQLKEHTFGPSSTSDEPTQFKMDEDTDHDTSGRELLADAEPQLSFKPPPDVFELQAVLSRHLSQASGHPQQQQQPRQPVSAAQAPSNNNEPVGQGKDKARMPAIRHDSLEWIDGVDDNGQMKSPARNARSPNLTVTIPSTTEADPATAAATQSKAPVSGSTVDGGDSGSKQRERFVAPPSQTPDVPLSPEPNTPLWILNQPTAKNK